MIYDILSGNGYTESSNEALLHLGLVWWSALCHIYISYYVYDICAQMSAKRPQKEGTTVWILDE